MSTETYPTVNLRFRKWYDKATQLPRFTLQQEWVTIKDMMIDENSVREWRDVPTVEEVT